MSPHEATMYNKYIVKVELHLYDGMVVRAKAMQVPINDLARASSTSIGPIFSSEQIGGYGRILTQINRRWKIATPTLIKAVVSDGSTANLIMDNAGCDHNFKVSFVGVHDGYAISKVYQHTVMISRVLESSGKSRTFPERPVRSREIRYEK